MLTQLMNRPCLIVRRSASGSSDDYGNDIPGETVEETVCELQQQRREEQPEGGPAEDVWDLFFRAGTDIRSGDAVQIDGEGELEVIGDPWHARNPRTQVESHVEVTARRTRGAQEGS